MSYTHGQRGQQMSQVPGTPMVTQTPAVKEETSFYPIMRPIEITGLAATIVVAMTVTPAILQLLYRPVPKATTNQVVVGTITLPVTGSAIGQQVYKKIAPFEANPGGQLVWELTQASTAGSCIPGIVEGATTEIPAALTQMVASA